MRDRTFVDTSVLVYLFDADSPYKQACAREILHIDGQAMDLVVSTQVLQEFYLAVTQMLGRLLPDTIALEAVRSLGRLTVALVDPAMIESAIERSQAHTISFRDALIVQAALDSGCNNLLSEDILASRSAGDLRVNNPFLS